jgi:VanZ family protein
MMLRLYRHAVWARWFYALLASAIIFWQSSYPVQVPGKIPHLDKAIHFAMYFGLCMAYFNVATRGGARTSARACWVAFLLAVAYGLSDEWHQSTVPGRSADWEDVLADAVGAAVAIWLAWRLRERSARWGQPLEPGPAHRPR